VYIAFHWDGDPAQYAAGKYATEYVQLPQEMEDRFKMCLETDLIVKRLVFRVLRTAAVGPDGDEARVRHVPLPPVPLVKPLERPEARLEEFLILVPPVDALHAPGKDRDL